MPEITLSCLQSLRYRFVLTATMGSACVPAPTYKLLDIDL